MLVFLGAAQDPNPDPTFFVDRDTGRPAANGMSESLKEGLLKILVKQAKL